MRGAAGGAVLVAAAWPFLWTDAGAWRAGTTVLTLLLISLSLHVTVTWLRTPTLFQPAAVLVGAAGTAALLARGRALPLALLAALALGSLLSTAVWVVAGRRRAMLPAMSLAVTAVSWLALPRLSIRPFVRPVVAGFDLSSERAVYLVALATAVAAAVVIHRLRRTDLGRWLAAAASEDLALRSGIPISTAWWHGMAVAGGLAGLAGFVLALLDRGVPTGGLYSPAMALGYLAVPVIGGASLSGTVAATLMLAVILWAAEQLGVDRAAAGALLLVAAVLARPRIERALGPRPTVMSDRR